MKPPVRLYHDLNGIAASEHLVDTAVAAHLYAGREPIAGPPVGKGKFPGLLSIPIDTDYSVGGRSRLIVASHFQLDIRVACFVAPKDAHDRNGQIGSPCDDSRPPEFVNSSHPQVVSD